MADIERPSKPRLLYLTPDYTGEIVPNNMEPIIYRIDNWLSHFFDIARVTTKCSLAAEIENHSPDLILFDGFLDCLSRKALNITDLSEFPEIPRAGFCRVDGLSPTRAPLFDYYNRVGADAIFVLGDFTMAESYADAADRIYYVPQFIDPTVYRNYGLFKSIPVLLVGDHDNIQYPWRTAVKQPILDRFPACYFRHPGYLHGGTSKNPTVIYGEAFAKTVNSSLIVPTSGGFKNIAVSKHVEIPGAAACLVCEETLGVRMYGFKSMENCVFATAQETPDAIQHLLEDRDLLSHITSAGFEFAHSRHTLRERNQLIDWMNLAKRRGPGQRIAQPDPFGPMHLVEENSPVQTFHLTGSDDVKLLEQGDMHLWKGELDEAIEKYSTAQKLCSYMAEPSLRNGIALLLKGEAKKGWDKIWHDIHWYLHSGALTGDPIDVAYAMIALLCQGQVENALGNARMHSRIRRIELDRARWAVLVACGQVDEVFDLDLVEKSKDPQSPTIHSLPRFTFSEQMDIFLRMLNACKQNCFANNLRKFKEFEEKRRAYGIAPLQMNG